jgi:hypothetical protein
MSSIQSTQSFQQTVIAELAALRAENSEMKVMLKELTAQPPASAAPKKRGPKKAAEPSDDADAEPPVKRAPSAYIVFSSKRVQPLVRAAEAELDKSAKSSVGTMNQFAGKLWAQTKESGKEWSDEEIMAEWEAFEPPAVSKQAAAGKNKKSPTSSVGEGEDDEPEGDAAEVAKRGAKKGSKWSAEAKASAKAKREASAAAKKAAAEEEDMGEVEAADAEEETPADAEEEEAPADAEEEEEAPAPPPPAPKKASVTPAAKKPAAPAPAPAAKKPAAPASTKPAAPKGKKPVDLFLDPWVFEGESYLKNERGDVMTTGGEWAGHWDGVKFDTDAPEPSDMETLRSRGAE